MLSEPKKNGIGGSAHGGKNTDRSVGIRDSAEESPINHLGLLGFSTPQKQKSSLSLPYAQPKSAISAKIKIKMLSDLSSDESDDYEWISNHHYPSSIVTPQKPPLHKRSQLSTPQWMPGEPTSLAPAAEKIPHTNSQETLKSFTPRACPPSKSDGRKTKTDKRAKNVGKHSDSPRGSEDDSDEEYFLFIKSVDDLIERLSGNASEPI